MEERVRSRVHDDRGGERDEEAGHGLRGEEVECADRRRLEPLEHAVLPVAHEHEANAEEA